MSNLNQIVIESIAAIYTSQIPEEAKQVGLIKIIEWVNNGLLTFQEQGYRVTETTIIKQHHSQMKRTGVEALMMLSQQPAKSE